MRTLSLGISPCPNDTFIFHALIHGLVTAADLGFDPRLADVEELNGWAVSGEPDVCKVSVGCVPELAERYALLRSGGALGRGVGPVLVAREDVSITELEGATVALPGARTTAARLFARYCGHHCVVPRTDYMLFSDIPDAVASGRASAGVLIHEGRFTYADHGLHLLADLGEFWETHSGLPVPLGCIVIRRDLGREIGCAVEAAVSRSLLHAREHPDASREYVRTHAQEFDDSVIRKHIDTFVTDHSLDMGDQGAAALAALLGLPTDDLFI